MCTYTLLDTSGLTENCDFVWRLCVTYLYSYSTGLYCYLFLFDGWNFASFVSLYLCVPDKGSLLSIYRDCIISNNFELYLMRCGVMILLLIHIYIYVPYILYIPCILYIYIIQQFSLKYVAFESTLLYLCKPLRSWTCA